MARAITVIPATKDKFTALPTASIAKRRVAAYARVSTDSDDAIVSITHKSCAALAIQCLADSGITDWQTAFNQQISNAKKLGLMPDDFKVIRETLQNFGFVLQGTAIEGMRVSDVLFCLCKLRTAATVFLQVSDYMHLGGNMMAVQINDGKYSYVNTPSDSNFPNMRRFSHVWIRWSDGIDRSPYPRRSVNRTSKHHPERENSPKRPIISHFSLIPVTTTSEIVSFVQYLERWILLGVKQLTYFLLCAR